MAGPTTMLYDGDCGFCTSVAMWWQQHLSRADLGTAVAYQSVPDLSLYGVTREDARAALHVVQPGVVLVGGEAVIGAFRLLRFPWRIVGDVSANVLGRRVANALYPIVARNRHRLPGATSTCEISVH